jgi:hypothetical protein
MGKSRVKSRREHFAHNETVGEGLQSYTAKNMVTK